MLSFDGWSVGIAYCLKLLLDLFFGIFVIVKAKKSNIRLLMFPGIAYISASLAHIPFTVEFIHILVTGKNLQINNLFLFIYITFLQIDIFALFCLGINLTITQKKNLLTLISSVYMIFVEILALFLPHLGFLLNYPSSPGVNLIKPYLQLNSILFYLILPYLGPGLIYIIGLLLKSLKLKGKVRTKFLLLDLGNISCSFWLFLVLLSKNVGFFYALFFIGSLFVIWITFYYGLTPVKEKKPKKKKTPSDVQQKFVSYLMKKPASNQAIEDESLVSRKLDKDILVFVSYSSKDSKTFKIQDVAEQLKSYLRIKDVLFYEGESIDNIIKYMNDNLGQCDAFLLFCSENALSSVPVEKEWTAAEAMGLPIIPIFYDLKHVPPLLQSRFGIEYDFYNLDQTIKEIYSTIIKKCIEIK